MLGVGLVVLEGFYSREMLLQCLLLLKTNMKHKCNLPLKEGFLPYLLLWVLKGCHSPVVSLILYIVHVVEYLGIQMVGVTNSYWLFIMVEFCANHDCWIMWNSFLGGMLLLELNRLLRPGGHFVWSATPVYQKLEEDVEIWKGRIITYHIFDFYFLQDN